MLHAVYGERPGPDVAEGDVLLRPGRHAVDREVQPELGGAERDVRLPIRWHLEVGGQRIGVGLPLCGAVRRHQGVGDGRSAGEETRVGLQVGQEGVALVGGQDRRRRRLEERAVGLALHQNGVDRGPGGRPVAVGDEHVRQTAREKAHAARQLPRLRAVLGAHPGHEHVQAVEVGLVRVPVAGDEVRIQGGLVAHPVVVVANAVVEGQPLVDVPGVLEQPGRNRIVVHSGRAEQRAGYGPTVGQLVRASGGEVGDRVEVVNPVSGLDEQIEDVHVAILDAGFDQVVLETRIARDELAGLLLGLQHVRLPELVRPELDLRHAAGAGGEGAGRGGIGADGDVAEALAFRRVLPPLIRAIGDPRLGRKGRRPIGVQLQGVVVLRLRLDVPVRFQIDVRDRGAAFPHRGIGVPVGGGEPLAVGDVPVDLDRRLLVDDRLG